MTTILSNYRLAAGKNDVDPNTWIYAKDLIKSLSGKAGLKPIKSAPVAQKNGNRGLFEATFLVPGPGYTNAAKDGHSEFVLKDQDILREIKGEVVKALAKFFGIKTPSIPDDESGFGSEWKVSADAFKTPDKEVTWYVTMFYKKARHSYDAEGRVEIYIGSPHPEFKPGSKGKSGFKPTKNWLYVMIRFVEQ